MTENSSNQSAHSIADTFLRGAGFFGASWGLFAAGLTLLARLLEKTGPTGSTGTLIAATVVMLTLLSLVAFGVGCYFITGAYVAFEKWKFPNIDSRVAKLLALFLSMCTAVSIAGAFAAQLANYTK